MLSGFAVKNKGVSVDQVKLGKASVQVLTDDLVKTRDLSKQANPEGATKPGEIDDQNEKVHIPESFEDFDDSETLSAKLRGIGTYTDTNLENKQNGEDDDHQIWHMEVDETTENASQIMTEMLKQQGTCQDKAADTEML